MEMIEAGVFVVALVALVVVLGVHPQLSSHSRFELRRRARAGDTEAALLLKRRALLADIFSLQRVIVATLLVVLSVTGVELFHWAVGLVVSFIIALESGAVASLPPLQSRSQKLYSRYEAKILGFIEHHRWLFRMIRSVAPVPSDTYDIESKQELRSIVAQSGDVLTAHEKRLIANGLNLDTMQVSEVMTPKSMIATVSVDEVLGPLVLTELHETGYSRFPVVEGDIDHIVGMLYVQDLLETSDRARVKTVKAAMDKKVFYIRQDQSLQHALAAFIRVRHHLFIVVNQFRETVGLLTLEDVLEALLGRKINDEFDAYDDLRQVAAYNPRKNNLPEAGHTV